MSPDNELTINLHFAFVRVRPQARAERELTHKRESDYLFQNMAQTGTQPSGSDVSKVESDISQTISLAGAVSSLIREPIIFLYNSVTKKQEQDRSLGFWKEEAIDEHGQCRIPVLRIQEFEPYLIDNNGVIPASTPKKDIRQYSGDQRLGVSWSALPKHSPPLSPSQVFVSSGTACWAYFLYSLGIRPSMNLVQWRPCVDSSTNKNNSGVQLEVDGPVLCHIINLYSTTHHPWGHTHEREIADRRQERRCNLDFGQLAWDYVDDHIQAYFTPGSISGHVSETQAFGDNAEFMEEGTAMALYLTTLENRVSDSRYSLLPPSAPLSERIDRLAHCFGMMNYRKWYGHSEKTLFISYDWFEEAARIKRRALAQGGGDHSFCHDAQRRKPGTSTRQWFLLDDEKFDLITRTHLSPEAGVGEKEAVLWETLLGYEHEPEGSWKRSLFEMREHIIKVLRMPKEIEIKSVMKIQLVEFTASSDLWHRKVLLGGGTQR